MNRKHPTIHLHDKSKTLVRAVVGLVAGGLLLVACWAIFGGDQATGDSYSAANGLTRQMLWNPSPK